jgi:hypothetical protein
VEAWNSELMLGGETRMDCGWRLAKLSWRLVRTHLALLVLGLGFAVFAGFAGAAALSVAQRGGGFAVAAEGLAALFLGVLLQTALVFAADDALDGGRMLLREALGDARERLGAIAAWTAVAFAIQVTLFFLLAELSNRGGLLVSLGAFAWSFGTVFVVPMLALEQLRPSEALRDAAPLLRRRWGEEFAGAFGIGGVTALAAIPAGILVGAAAHRNHLDQGSGDLALAIGSVLLLAVFVASATVSQTFAVALYRDGTLGYPDARAYVERRPRRKSWIVRIGLFLLSAVLVLGIVAAILGPQPHPSEQKVAFPAAYARWVTAGMPVVYENHEVGEVTASEISGGRDIVSFEIESPYDELQGSSTITVSAFKGGSCLIIVPSGQAPPGAGGPEAGAA